MHAKHAHWWRGQWSEVPGPCNPFPSLFKICFRQMGIVFRRSVHTFMHARSEDVFTCVALFSKLQMESIQVGWISVVGRIRKYCCTNIESGCLHGTWHVTQTRILSAQGELYTHRALCIKHQTSPNMSSAQRVQSVSKKMSVSNPCLTRV